MMTTLDELDHGERATVTAVGGVSATSQRLLALGLLPGTAIRIVAVAPMGDPITVESPAGRVSLRRGEAAAVEVARNEPSTQGHGPQV